MKYKISFPLAFKHFISVSLELDCDQKSSIEVQLPAWRPGRYELANYSKNIQQFQIEDESGEEISYKKIKKDRWKIKTSESKKVLIKYTYYTNQMDAGGSFVDENLIYLNFINCLLYCEESTSQPCTLELDIPDQYQISCSLKMNRNKIEAENYFQLVDSPLIAAPQLLKKTYYSHEIPFHIWIHGNIEPDWDKIIQDFKAFTDTQIKVMGDFPEKEYHFLIHVLPYPHYHGVEHASSTVITLGPASRLSEKLFYDNLLGVSSHELFHAWNVCKIRPAEMLPYDFSLENYFETGYVAEGFTTYYGNLMLARAGVFTTDEYFNELNTLFKRHYENFGRLNRSLAESSLDLWLDGYTPGIPDRKVSIYVKGAIVALLLDLQLRKSSENEKTLDDVMRTLWEQFGKTQKGYTAEDITKTVKEIGGKASVEIIKKYVYTVDDEEPLLQELLKTVGCQLEKKDAELYHERNYGFRVKSGDDKTFVDLIVPESPADETLVKGDQILNVNQKPVSGNIAELCDGHEVLEMEVLRNHLRKVVKLNRSGQEYLPTYSIIKNTEATDIEKKNFKSWLNQEF